MTTNQKISGVLLLGRSISVVFIFMTIRLQYYLLKLNNDPSLQWYRKKLFFFTIILLLGNFVPIVIDIFGLFEKGSFGLLLLYVFSNNITAMIGAILMWSLYDKARKQ